MRVFVYFNLHKKLWSIRALEGPDRGRVIAHKTHLALRDCVFKVSEAGRQRVLRERCKNVHAGVIGTLWEAELPGNIATNVHVTYNPYLYTTFVDVSAQTPRLSADWVEFLDDRKVFVS